MADKLFTTYWTELAAAALAHADAIGVEDTGGLFTATDVEAALAEVKTLADAAVTPAEAAAAYQPLDADLTALATAGNSSTLAATTASFLTADETKLDGIETGAQVNTVTATSTTTFTNKTADSFTNTIAADDIHFQVRNESGGTLTKGTPVYASGYNVGQELVQVDAADASVEATAFCIGLVEADIATNATGGCVAVGVLTDVDTSAFSVGDILYVSETAGALTATAPTGAAFVQRVGEVLRSNAVNGVIDISMSQTRKTGFAHDLLSDATAADARTTLGLGTAATTASTAYDPAGSAAAAQTASQPLDADLTALAAAGNSTTLAAITAAYTTAEASKLAAIEAAADVTDTTNVTAAGALMDSEVDADIKTLSLPANTTISTFGATLVDDADNTAARTTLGLGTMATATATDYLAKVAGGASVENVGAIEENVETASVSTTKSLDTSTYGVFDMTMTAATTFTFTNPAPSGKATSFVLILRGAFTPTLPASIDWSGGSAPTYTTPSVYTFTTVNATDYFGSQVGAAFA